MRRSTEPTKRERELALYVAASFPSGGNMPRAALAALIAQLLAGYRRELADTTTSARH